jgi:hypothetical protein
MTTHQEESPPHDDKGEENEDETRRKDDQETNLTEHPVSDGVAPGVAPDDDDDDSVSSDSSAEGDTPAHDDWQSLTILERRARRISRNEKKLTALGLGYTTRPVRRAVAPVPNDNDDDDDRPRPRRRGILLDFASAGVYPPKPQEPPGISSPPTVVDSVRLAPTPKEEEPLGRRLARDFPGRAPVIRALLAHLEMALPPRPSTDASSLTAPAPLWISGPAGTGKSALVRAAVDAWRRARPEMLVSYVALEGLPTVSVEAVVRHIYKDLMPPEEDAREETAYKSRKRQRSATAAAPQEGALPLSRRPRRETAVYTAAAGTTTTSAAGGKSTSVRATAQDMAASTVTKASGAYTAIWRLGRVWKSLAARRPSVLVLDQVWLGREPNILAQFLLLPRQLSMNLTIIVITNNLLLDQTRTCIYIHANGGA